MFHSLKVHPSKNGGTVEQVEHKTQAYIRYEGGAYEMYVHSAFIESAQICSTVPPSKIEELFDKHF